MRQVVTIPKTRLKVEFSDMIHTEHGRFEYVSSGEFVSSGEWIHPERVIDSHELILVTRGEVHIREQDECFVLSNGDCLLLEAGKLHAGVRRSICATSFLWFHFCTELPLPFKYAQGCDLYDVKYLFKKLLHMSRTPNYSERELDATALLLFYELYHIRRDEGERSFAAKLSEYVRINACNGITVRDVAEYFGYNCDYIGKLFKKSYDLGLKEYISSCRLAAAKDLLLNTDDTVKQIAAKLGFNDSNSFIKYFLYHEKLSPTDFRNRYFNTHLNNK